MELTDRNYHEIIKGNEKPVFVDFYSPTCGPCQILLQLIEDELEEYARKRGVVIATCDVSRNPRLADAFKIRSVPFTIAVLPDESLKFPELGLKEPTYYFDLIDRLGGKKRGFFSRIFG